MAHNYRQIQDYYPLLKYPEKYVGSRPITTRSSWESKMIRNFFDADPSVKTWSSESIVIPYISPKDNRKHRYYPDFWAQIETPDGKLVEHIIEVKPDIQTRMPKAPKRVTKQYREKVMTFMINKSKWKSTIAYCSYLKEQKSRNISFKIINEYDLGIKKRKVKKLNG